MKNIKKILAILLVLVIALGIFCVVKYDFNYGIEYKKATELKFMLGQVLNMDEVENIVKESFNNKQIKIQKIDYFNDSVNITVVDPTDEEIQTLIDKFNERYEQNNTIDSIAMVKTGNLSILEIIKPYILPILVALVMVSVYMTIRFKKYGMVKMFALPIVASLIVEAVLFAIYAIVRIPVSLYTMPLAMFALLITLTVIAYKYEKKESDK